MPINVKPVSAVDPDINELRERTASIVNNEILPNENRLWPGVASRSRPGTARKRSSFATRSRPRSRRLACGHRTCRKSTGGWGWGFPSSRTRT